MKPAWQIDGDDIKQFQGNSPGFVRFLNDLLRVQADRAKLPGTPIHLTQKDSEKDGGVDAVIDQAIPPDCDPTGRFGVPTCWQFKARPAERIKAKVRKGEKGGQQVALRQAINDPHARRLVEQGYGYRFCIADDMPHQKKAQWERWLLEAAQAINAGAASPMVLTASDLALWARGFLGLVRDHFRPFLRAFHSLETWHKEISGLTPQFVEIGKWALAVEAIREHVDFNCQVTTVLTVHGEAGVGKTRCTCEALLADPAHHALVLYTKDEQKALELAQTIAGDDQAEKAILVADECTLQVRERLRQILPGCGDRLRVIAIDNSLQRAGGTGEVHLSHIELEEVETILQRNFPTLPLERRVSYARLAGGFVRLAVDLCQNDAMVPAGGRVDSLPRFLHDSYLRNRLNNEELEAVLLISLLSRVGYRDDLAGQLESLCNHPKIGLRSAGIVSIAQRLQKSPGFIAFGGRFLYITPTLIAKVAFQSAWECWIERDPGGFLSGLPADLIDPFVERVQNAGTTEMRDVVFDFFLEWVRSLGPPDLGREASVSRLVHLIEVQPEKLVPILRDLIERTTLDGLRRLHAGHEGQEARRELVWLAEKLAYFPEYFADAEAMLLRLALAETEPHLGNNATRVWSALFRIVFSGTPVPFPERLRLLEERLRGADAAQFPLVLGALDKILAVGPVGRLAAPQVVFGRLPPPQWQPAGTKEIRDCRSLSLVMSARLAATGGMVADPVRATVIKRLAPLLLGGHIEEARAVVGSGPLPDALLVALGREIEQFCDVFCKDDRIPVHRANGEPNGTDGVLAESGTVIRSLPRTAGSDLEARVREWYQTLVPSDLHGRLVSLVGQDYWHRNLQGDADAWQRTLQELAAELLHSPAALNRERGWLCSTEARSAFHLGQALGDADGQGDLLDRMLSEFPLAGGTPLARGYVDRITTSHARLLVHANDLLDRLQAEHPRIAYEVIWSAGDEVHKVTRLFQMVDSGGLPADFLRGLEYGARDRALTVEELLQALERLTRAAQSGQGRAAHAATHLLFVWLHSPRQSSGRDIVREEKRLHAVLSAVLELALDAEGEQPSDWMMLLEDLAIVEIDRAIGLAVRALAGEEYQTRILAEEFLVRTAGSRPDMVMHRVGEAILSAGAGWRFRVHVFSRLFDSLPIEVVRRWLDGAGVMGARGVARHLAPPHLDGDGRTVVPELTELVLNRFGDDEQVFSEFCAGVRTMPRYRPGDLPAQLDCGSSFARHFAGHPIKRVRDWALSEVESARRESAYRRQRDEEMARA
ncbi:MAG: hypothetical protein ACHRXM_07505 [Isosphaerales bacterium]